MSTPDGMIEIQAPRSIVVPLGDSCVGCSYLGRGYGEYMCKAFDCFLSETKTKSPACNKAMRTASKKRER